MGAKEADTCVARVPIFQGLTPDQQLEVARLARPLRLGRGEVIHQPGDNLSQLIVVHQGRVKISRLEASGQEQLVRVMEPGDFIGEAAFLTGKESDHWSSALTGVQLCTFHHRDLAALVAAHPKIAMRMMRTLAARLETAERRAADLTLVPAPARLARYIVAIAQSAPEFQLPYAKKDVASLLGMTPETFSRQLANLESQGVLEVKGRTITLLNAEALLATASNADTP